VPLAAKVGLADGRVRIETTRELEDLHRLTTWALEHRHRLPGLTVQRMTLEDAYLHLTSGTNRTADDA
jgi:hypothetical protein